MAALSYRNQPLPNYLAGNPVIFELMSNSPDMISFHIAISESIIYTGTLMPSGSGTSFEANISISEILKSYIKSSKVEDMALFVSPVSNSFTSISVFFTQPDSLTLPYFGKIYKGGVGKKMLRYLKSKNTDIFSYKLRNADKQFFLTTRTFGRHIVIKENELYPLYFIATERAYSIITEYGNVFAFPTMVSGNVYAFNIEVLRRLSYNAYQNIPAYFAVLIDGKFVFDITVKEPAKSPYKYVIQFLNSFSAYERMEVTGKAISEPEFSEDNAFMVYDQGIDDYIEQNNRLDIREVMTVDFGYKTLDEFLFMRDMLQSDKRYLIDQDGNQHEVRVSCETFSHDLFPTEPGSVQLKIRFVDSDSNYSPDIDESDSNFTFGTGIWDMGITNAQGFLYAESILKTI